MLAARHCIGPTKKNLLVGAAIWGILAFGGCQHGARAPVEPSSPAVIQFSLNTNPHNVVSALARVTTKSAATVAVEYGVDSQFINRTPFHDANGTPYPIPVLGLKENRLYQMRAIAMSFDGQMAYGDTLVFSTGTLPATLPSISIQTNGSPADGYVLLGVTAPTTAGKDAFFAFAVNNSGDAVWYREFPAAVVDFQKQPGGSYTVFSAFLNDVPHFFELDNLGNIIRELGARDVEETDSHELRFVDEGYCLITSERRLLDLTALGGMSGASVRGTGLEYRRSGRPLFVWSPFDHLLVADAAPDISVTESSINPWHANAIDIDHDGHLLLSLRNSDEIVKIDSETGQILWRLGGKQNQFAFIDDPLNGFSHQHGIRRLANGNLILFDNGNLHTPPESRAVEYEVDERAMTARLVWQYRPGPALFAFAMGFAQRLPSGNTLINFGTAQKIVEVDNAGAIRWGAKIDGEDCYSYRAFRIDSLY